jgi:tetratricopeptide (TPR) repeat protein
VDRVIDREEIQDLLSADGARVVIYGLPGMGKTAMAAKIAAGAQDSLEVGTVLWADFGRAADAVDVLRSWCQALTADVSGVTGTPQEQLEYLRDRLTEAVSGQDVLFVLDDVGSSQGDLDAASECLIDDENCRYLLTTISTGTTDHFQLWSEFESFHLQELGDLEAGQVLERYALDRLSLATLDDADRERLLRLGDGLPLGLMVLGRFLGQGLRHSTLNELLHKLASAEALVQQGEFGTRLHQGRGGEPASIDTILTARWIDLPPDQKEALQTAAVFREKPHEFGEMAWAGLVAARRSSPADAEDLAQRFGARLAKTETEAELKRESGKPHDIGSPDAENDDLQLVIQAGKRLEPLREALMDTGLLERRVLGEPSFTMHSLIAAFLRTILGLDADELKRLHGLAGRYYRGWLLGYQENHAVASPYKAAYRLENRQWLNATLDVCYHEREAGSEDEALLLLTTLFFDAFWWWGELVSYPLCDELLRMWQLAHLGDKAAECLWQLHQFNDRYPAIDLDLVPPNDPMALPSGYQDDTQVDNFQAVRAAVQSIRDQVLGGVVDDDAKRDRVRFRMLTAIYLGEAHRVIGQLEQADRDYQEALKLLEDLGQGENDGDERDTDEQGADDSDEKGRDDSDDWIIPHVYTEVADLHVRLGDPAKALDACDQGVQAAVDDEMLLLDLDDEKNDTDSEVLGWLWLAAGDAYWKAGRLPEVWRSYAWACFHACTAQLWPERVVLYERPGQIPERKKEFGVDDYTVTCYKLHLATMLDRLGELWTTGRQAEACAGVRLMRETLAGGPDKPSTRPDERGRLEEVAAIRPETAWEDCRDLAWQDTGLAGLALPLIPWERLVDGQDRADQRRAASDLSARLKDIWTSSKWTLDSGPGQQGLSLDVDVTGAVESDMTGEAE